MGLSENQVEFLAWAKREGVRFERTMTLGRQECHRLTPERMCRAFRKHGLHVSEAEAEADLRERDGFAEPLLARLGAEEIRSMDASSFEGASDIHDLNEPIHASLKHRFSAVIDSGTLEHVFNFPQAIANAMEMVELGGHLLLITPTNNEGGHGFYQFAPELFFRILSPENGFTVKCMLLREHLRQGWWEVVDPAEINHRSQFRSRGVAYLYVRARREEIVAPFDSWPQQSDYAATWSPASADVQWASHPSRSGRRVHATMRSLKTMVRRFLPQPLLNQHRSLRQRRAERADQHPVLFQHQHEQFRRVLRSESPWDPRRLS